MATRVAPMCNGWNHRPAVSLDCYQHVKERVCEEEAGIEPAVDRPHGGLSPDYI